jgi:hypothetical protein
LVEEFIAHRKAQYSITAGRVTPCQFQLLLAAEWELTARSIVSGGNFDSNHFPTSNYLRSVGSAA